MRNLSIQRKLKSLFVVTVSGFGVYSIISILKNDEIFYKNILMPVVHLLDPEDSHRLGIFIAKHRLLPKNTYPDPESLHVRLFGKVFKNPIGIAAGFDKDAEAVLGLRDIGFGFIEIGSVTPHSQPGNPKPRVFRLSEDLAVINRYGFNSQGHGAVVERVQNVQNAGCDSIIGVNLGKNKSSDDPINDYVTGVKTLGPLADYVVINISSPNTPGLRSMQDKNVLKKLLQSVLQARNGLERQVPILVKLAPDLSLQEVRDICSVISQKETRIDGVIISNTTIDRPQFLQNSHSKGEVGGLSGKPLKLAATKMITDVYKLTKGEIPIIGVGGIFTGRDAYEKIKAGATVVQIYTSLVYEGPPVVTKIKKELAGLLEADGYSNISQAIGCDVKL